jgi:urease accessory protein
MPAPSLDTGSAIFAANRARGHVALEVAFAAGRTRRVRVDEQGALRVRFPTPQTEALDAVLLNTAGGMAGGDRFSTAVFVESSASLGVTTAAAEKVYRSLEPAAEVQVTLRVGAGGSLAWLPQETILFDGARLTRNIDIELDAGASLFLVEAIVFGRAAMGETMEQGLLHDRWRLRRKGRLLWADGIRLAGDVAGKLARRASAGGAGAVATLLIVPGNETQAAALLTLQDKLVGECGVSSWNGITLARFCATDGAALRSDLIASFAALQLPLPRSWVN